MYESSTVISGCSKSTRLIGWFDFWRAKVMMIHHKVARLRDIDFCISIEVLV